MMVTSRDLEVLRWIGQHGIVTTEQIQRRFFTGSWAAYRRVRALERRDLLRRDQTFWKEPLVIRLTPAGARLAGVGLAPAELVLAEVRHSLAVVDLTERLAAEHPGAALVTERMLRAAQLRRWREEGTRTRFARIPDGVLCPDTGGRIAIELDLTPKRSREITRVIDAYSAAYSRDGGEDRFTAVWWYVLPAIVGRMQEIVAHERATFILVKEWSR